MKNFLTRFGNGLRVAVLTVLAGAATGVPAVAQNAGQQVLQQATSSFSELLDSLASFLRIALGAGALIMLVMAIYQLMKGERDAAQKLAYWVVGLALGFALLTVVLNVTRTAA